MLNFEEKLQHILKTATLHPQVRSVHTYAVLPPGKLFRPRLLEALATDLGAAPADVLTLGCALELQHAYSLVHDDLPSMDDDDVRRGKPTTHKAFGEWQALLTGDSLLILSLATLEQLQGSGASKIRRLFHWAVGPKGLILGQWIDLDESRAKSFATVLRMHELKTARLMQIATLGALWIAHPAANLKDIKRMLRLGSSIGIAFQLLDDLDDLSRAQLSAHEKAVNPFLTAPAEARKKLAELLQLIEGETLVMTKKFLQSFLQQSAQELMKNENLWAAHVPSEREALKKLLTSGICA